jgi:thiol-disulfide isomerase/thioredoxin
MSEHIDHDRRRLLRRSGGAFMSLAAGRLGAWSLLGTALEPLACAAAPADPKMPSLDGATAWLNTPALTASSLRGKVVLVQFWTLSCINWLRTLPYVRAWAEKYGPEGLTVLGVHSPEFAFEKNVEAVRRAVAAMRIHYPVAVDSDLAVWDAFRNGYWPALYFIDHRGSIRRHHFGEGEYDRSERFIQTLLAEAGVGSGRQDLVRIEPSGVEADADWGNLRSQENYVGYARTQNFASPGGVVPDARHVYAAPARLGLNDWALSGAWTVRGQPVSLDAPNGRIAYRFHARDLHLVMGPAAPGTSVRFRVRVDGNPPGEAHGLDVDAAGDGTATEQRLYQLVRQPKPITDRLFEIEFLDAGVEAFSFTFG